VWQQTGTRQSVVWAGLDWQVNDPAIPSATREYSDNVNRWNTPDPGGVKVVKLDNPQTWNMYAYVTDNPKTLNDPSGLYTCKECEEQCAKIKAAVSLIHQAAASSRLTADQRERLAAVSRFLGTDTDKNGVIIELGSAHGNAGETRTSKGVTEITLDFSSFASKSPEDSAERSALTAHEATHGIDQRAHGMPAQAN